MTYRLIFFIIQTLENQRKYFYITPFCEKKFAGNEKGCIFASAFAQKTGVEKKAGGH